MKTTLIHSSYDKNTGISKVALGSKYGIFWATSTLLEEDKDFASEYRGCDYAETKAYLKILKAELKERKAQYKGMVNLFKAMKNYKDTDPVTMHYISKQIDIQDAKVRELKDEIEVIEKGLQKRFENDPKVIKKLRDMTNKSLK